MDKYRTIETKSLLLELFIRIFSNRFIIVFFDIVMTTIISLHTATIDLQSKEWMKKLGIYILIYLALNFICILADYMKNKNTNSYKFLFASHQVQNTINAKTATNLYRVNKKITKVVREQKIEKGEINSIADFQSLSFLVCTQLHDFIVQSIEE